MPEDKVRVCGGRLPGGPGFFVRRNDYEKIIEMPVIPIVAVTIDGIHRIVGLSAAVVMGLENPCQIQFFAGDPIQTIAQCHISGGWSRWRTPAGEINGMTTVQLRMMIMEGATPITGFGHKMSFRLNSPYDIFFWTP